MASRDMTLRDHLEELRRRLFIIVAAVIVSTVVAFIFRDRVLDFLLAPGFDDPEAARPVFTEVTEMLAVTMKTSLMAGVVLALPVVLYQLVMFVSPGLTRRERIYLFSLIPGMLVAFAGGVAFGYYVLVPPAFNFLFTFGTSKVDPFIRIDSYISVITRLLFWLGLVFELPLVQFLLARLGVVTARRMARFRRFSIVLAFMAAALITPTIDPVNQALVAIPIILLYEVGIVLARLGERLHRQPPPLAETT